MQPSGQAALGTRVQFNGDGGNLFKTYLLYGVAPLFGAYVVAGIPLGLGIALADSIGAAAVVFVLIGALILFAALAITPSLFMQKFYEFYHEGLVMDGQRVQYVGKLGDFMKVQFINRLLIGLTFGIYTPWAMVKTKKFLYENTVVNGQPNRLTFDGDPSALLGTYLVGSILMMCTFGIYGPWFANNLFAFQWENTKLDGRPFRFQKDPGGFFGTYLLAMILSNVTCGIYLPWGICNILKWETERVT
jgi:uncharacterized membrane protein YjgN (DUF898 family)